MSTPSPQKLDRTLTAYRIGDPNGQFDIMNEEGSCLFPGRWNDSVSPVIYASENYSTAMLEKLAHGNGILPPNQHFVRLTIPKGMSYVMVTKDTLPGWQLPSCVESKAYGVEWHRTQRSLLLIVPSLVAREELNFVINPYHHEYGQITCDIPKPVWWDERLFD